MSKNPYDAGSKDYDAGVHGMSSTANDWSGHPVPRPTTAEFARQYGLRGPPCIEDNKDFALTARSWIVPVLGTVVFVVLLYTLPHEPWARATIMLVGTACTLWSACLLFYAALRT